MVIDFPLFFGSLFSFLSVFFRCLNNNPPVVVAADGMFAVKK